MSGSVTNAGPELGSRQHRMEKAWAPEESWDTRLGLHVPPAIIL